ncbi:hypothetical protein OJ996_11245 [Luteolibacter sp. GHJ8]|uniref:Uncharacterized protein n=1 Tax=Luteolibacter rhizosphaerae TaxID=2989719 RepID=A0ABT3G2T1_9BACT|nr:hypothetical protein [Luteolibacter rhizosphaerae]MCW1914155.1 hypothetical protein [Luteolibacter rhizosphaerae]
MNRRRLAIILLTLALVLFVAFHFLPWNNDRHSMPGWEVWRYVSRIPRSAGDLKDLLPTTGFFTSSLILVASPLLVPVFETSRLARNLVLVMSGLALIGVTGFLLYVAANFGRFLAGSGMICMMLAQALHLAGMVVVKPRPKPSTSRV